MRYVRGRDSYDWQLRIEDDQCEIRADTSGDLLHRRGYRKEVAKAPLRETLAAAIIAGVGTLGAAVGPARVPVLRQIELPHNYYYRELYLPQLTSGPSSAAWSADGNTLVYSMQGSLWRQRADDTVAEQLTDDRGADYQPDCSPDGRSVAFVRYDGRSMELMMLDLTSRVHVGLIA